MPHFNQQSIHGLAANLAELLDTAKDPSEASGIERATRVIALAMQSNSGGDFNRAGFICLIEGLRA